MKTIALDSRRLHAVVTDVIRHMLEETAPDHPSADSPASASVHLLAGRIGDRVHVLKAAEISFIGSEDGNSYAIVKGRKHYLGASLCRLEDDLDRERFIRVHRGYLVNINHIRTLDRWPGGKFLITLEGCDGTQLTTSRAGAERLRRTLGLERKS